jgi:hypothetical protein
MNISTIDLYNSYCDLEAKKGLNNYLANVVVDSMPPKLLSSIWAPWQANLFKLIVPLIESACGYTKADKKALYVTAGRGHSKTSMVGMFLNWALCYSKRNISACVAAATWDQAAILLERMRAEASHNPYLNITFGSKGAKGPMGKLDVLSSDHHSVSGRLDDIIIADELVWHTSDDLFNILMSGRHKRKDSVVIITTNSGYTETWQYDLYLMAKTSPNWILHEVPAFSAKWMDTKAIQDDKVLLPPSVFARLHLNQWVNQQEYNGFVSRPQIEACIDPNLYYKIKGE